MRSAYRGHYGLSNLGRVGLKGDFPRGVVRLHRHAVTVKASLESPDLDLEPVLELELEDKEGTGTSVASQLAAQLDPELSRLGELLDERHRERGKTIDVRLQRQSVIREFDYNVRGIIRMAQGMFRLAGRDDLGRRIRPILKRVLRKLEDLKAKENQEAEDDGESGTGEESGATEATESTESTETAQAGQNRARAPSPDESSDT